MNARIRKPIFPNFAHLVFALWTTQHRLIDAFQCVGQHCPMDERIPLTDDMVALLNAEIDRTGSGLRRVLVARDDIPGGLTENIVGSWIDRRVKTLRRDYYEYVVRCYAEAPLFPTITPDIQSELRGHRDRTGVGPAVLLGGVTDIPEGLSIGTIESWLSGISTKATEVHLNFVLNRYRNWPSKDEFGRRQFPKEI